MRIAEHWVATTRGGAKLLEPRLAKWLWERLRRHFPHALSLVLMPDHIHLVVVSGAGAGDRLRHLLAACTGLFGVRFDVLPEEPANSRDIAFRQVRYGFLNPVRAELVDDAWSWPWSTLRDLAGAAYPIWTTPVATAGVLGLSVKSLLALTTSADHRHAPPRHVPIAVASLDALRTAVAATLRVSEHEVLETSLGRRLVIQASEAFARPGTAQLASALDCSERTIQRARTPRHSALDAVLLCLGDDRLRRGPDSIAPHDRRPRDWRKAR